MPERKVWFITGADRGMGAEIAKAALAVGNAVVATGLNADAVAKAVGEANDALIAKLDVTIRADAEAAVHATVDRFGRITIASQEHPPRRFISGTDAIGLAEQKVADLKAQIDAYYDLSTSLDLEAASLRA